MRVTASEREFLHELHAVRKDPLGKRLIHFFVSLGPQSGDMAKKTDGAKQFIKKSFAKSPYCEVFSLSNGDICVAYSHIGVSEVLGVCAKVEKVFLEDSVVSQRNAYNEYAFYKICDAVKDLDKVFAIFKAIIAQNQPEPEKFSKRPLTPVELVFLGEKLRTADLRNAIFNQPVYFIAEKVPSIEFLEFFISIPTIEESFLPETNLMANPWLFNSLREAFDRAILRTISSEISDYRHKGFSINLSLPTIFSRDFTDFYEALPTKLAGRIVLEIEKIDLVQNFSLFLDAVELAEEKGIKLCVDGMEWQDFDILSFGRVHPHYIKVIWHNDLLTAGDKALANLVDAVKHHDRSEIILTRCENPKAFPVAKAMGIRFVQGKLADQFFKSGMML